MTTTTFPPCAYCGQDLTDNERDAETGSFYSAHTGCVQPSADGRYVVVTYRDDEDLYGELPSRTYTTRARAEHAAEDLARNNSPHWSFRVVDRETGGAVATHWGKLPEGV